MSPGGRRGVGARLRPDVAHAGMSQQDQDPFIGSARLAAQQYTDEERKKDITARYQSCASPTVCLSMMMIIIR